ncbi:uncharacterized protein BDZ99DRAFT_513137 [Mytilinidion resinicola]|uniref:Uncharacterized protein n=1 Tax=Mytilinidion resinicola TaxID=574789 RepID=A0A6A6Z830_9PEZI|nr:uncharacterized protein BDZ99DRAFT_513137 [Mytilinidion resinicola]KAF2816869.1 hypothetical protein BDZ99DRAFT_513137 [Mytilinidion resinicola]
MSPLQHIAFNIIRLAWSDKVKSPDSNNDHAVLFCFNELAIQLSLILASVPIMQPILRNANLIQLGTIGSPRVRKYNNTLQTESAFDLDEKDEGKSASHDSTCFKGVPASGRDRRHCPNK